MVGGVARTVQGLAGVAPFPGRQDADRLVDGAAGHQRRAHVGHGGPVAFETRGEVNGVRGAGGEGAGPVPVPARPECAGL
ncbi:hypothetical protein TNCT6_31310 [Streptomyces sp. 6-11-2]|nr:hypothetical protein TNCT6_31310 [Streptomyces sp. 6-11-2]